MATAKVIFASITGNNEDIADLVAEELEKHAVEVTVDEISQADVSDLTNYDICVVCPYTYDGGSLPDEGLDFFDDLETEDLTGLVYGVAGSGDEFYGDDFCKAVTKFSAQLKEAGATQGAEDVKINLSPDSSEDLEKIAAFATQLAQAASKQD